MPWIEPVPRERVWAIWRLRIPSGLELGGRGLDIRT